MSWLLWFTIMVNVLVEWHGSIIECNSSMSWFNVMVHVMVQCHSSCCEQRIVFSNTPSGSSIAFAFVSHNMNEP